MNTSLDIEDQHALAQYLKSRGILSENTEVHISPLAGGVSNRTVLVKFNGNSWVLKQALSKLRVKGEWFSSPDRIYFEAEAMRWLASKIPGTCPGIIFEDKPCYILAMEAVHGPFDNLKTLFMNNPPRPALFEKAGRLLGRMHYHGQDKDQLPALLCDNRFFQSLRIEPYYLETTKRIKPTTKFFSHLIEETTADSYTFVHGDYSPKNLLVKDDRFILLDHEVAHFGDGTFDLGFFIAHLLSKANHRIEYRQEFLTGVITFFDAYRDSVKGINSIREQRAVRHSIGCFLARVCGLSPMDYLNREQRQVQKALSLKLVESVPPTINRLVLDIGEMMSFRK